MESFLLIRRLGFAPPLLFDGLGHVTAFDDGGLAEECLEPGLDSLCE